MSTSTMSESDLSQGVPSKAVTTFLGSIQNEIEQAEQAREQRKGGKRRRIVSFRPSTEWGESGFGISMGVHSVYEVPASAAECWFGFTREDDGQIVLRVAVPPSAPKRKATPGVTDWKFRGDTWSAMALPPDGHGNYVSTQVVRALRAVLPEVCGDAAVASLLDSD